MSNTANLVKLGILKFVQNAWIAQLLLLTAYANVNQVSHSMFRVYAKSVKFLDVKSALNPQFVLSVGLNSL